MYPAYNGTRNLTNIRDALHYFMTRTNFFNTSNDNNPLFHLSDDYMYDEYVSHLQNKTREFIKQRGQEVDDSEESLRKNMFGIAVILCLFTVVFNLILLIIIFTSHKLRTRPLFWNIISLAISDLIVGLFVLPIRLEYTDSRSWNYGIVMCKVWSVLDISHFCLSAMVVVSICSERILAKMETVTSIGPGTAKRLSLFVTLFPWAFLVFVCLPVLIVGEENIHYDTILHWGNHCSYVLETSFFIPSVTVMYLIPSGILIMFLIALVCVYVIKGAPWERLHSNTTEAERRSLRMSTIASMVVGIVTIIFWFPYIVLLFIYVTCREYSCMPSQATSAGIYMLSLTTSAITPFLWLLVVEVRETLALKVNPIVHKIHTRMGLRHTNLPREHNTELLVDNDL